MNSTARKLVAEFVGTFLLVFLAVGAAYAFGPISGAHVNPAVTLAMLMGRRMPTNEAVGYWIAQFAGAILGGAVLKLFVSSFGVTDYTGGLGTNSYDNGAINLAGAFVLEVLLTGAFVLVILLVTERVAAPGFAGLAIGLALTVVHLVGIPLDGTSVNPARSFGPALFAGGDALGQVWLFILAPLVGAVVAALVWRVTRTDVDITPEDMIAGSERE
jgi:aquaporin Z